MYLSKLESGWADKLGVVFSYHKHQLKNIANLCVRFLACVCLRACVFAVTTPQNFNRHSAIRDWLKFWGVVRQSHSFIFYSPCTFNWETPSASSYSSAFLPHLPDKTIMPREMFDNKKKKEKWRRRPKEFLLITRDKGTHRRFLHHLGRCWITRTSRSANEGTKKAIEKRWIEVFTIWNRIVSMR